jgi:hypothetical protein
MRKISFSFLFMALLFLEMTNSTGATESNDQLDLVEGYFSQLKNEILSRKIGAFPVWRNEIKYFLGPGKIDEKTRAVAIDTISLIKNLTNLNFIESEDFNNAGYIILIYGKTDVDIAKYGYWHDLTKKKFAISDDEWNLDDQSSLINCRTFYELNEKNINSAISFSVVSDANLAKLRSLGPRCLRASILVGLGFPANPMHVNSILKNYSSSQNFTLEDCVVLRIRHSSSFRKFTEGKLNQTAFRQEISTTYQHLSDNMSEDCVK